MAVDDERVPELVQRTLLNLTDPLSRERVHITDLSKGLAFVPIEAEAEAQDLGLHRTKGIERLVQGSVQLERFQAGVHGRFFVGECIDSARAAAVLGPLSRCVPLQQHLAQPLDLLSWNIGESGQLPSVRLAPMLVLELAADLGELCL